MVKHEKIAPEILQLADYVGKFMEYWGFKSIHGRIWTLVYLSTEPLSATCLCKKLRVSKTLLSFSIAELLEYKVIERHSKGHKRTVYYKANEDLTSVILGVLVQRERAMITDIQSAFGKVKKLHEKNKTQDFQIESDRLDSMQSLINSGLGALDALTLLTPPQSDLFERFNAVSEALGE